jgi:hypothetical protein
MLAERVLRAVFKIATPSNPATGYMLTYFKSDGKLYSLDESGVETCISAKGFVNHGSTAGTARPNFTSVEWYGSVAPTNAAAGDTWIDTST